MSYNDHKIRQKRSFATKKQWKDPKYRQLMSETAKENWKDMEYRKKFRETVEKNMKQKVIPYILRAKELLKEEPSLNIKTMEIKLGLARNTFRRWVWKYDPELATILRKNGFSKLNKKRKIQCPEPREAR